MPPSNTSVSAPREPTFGPYVAGNKGGIVSSSRSQYDQGNSSNQSTDRLPTGSQTWDYTRLPYAPYQQFNNDPSAMNYYEGKSTSVAQDPTHVYSGADSRIGNVLQPMTDNASAFASGRYTPTTSTLGSGFNTQFLNADALAPYMNGGVDYLGRLGMSEGASNILAQRNNANRALQASLGKNVANRSLINVLQNQNAFRSQLAMNPLYSEAQRGSYERALANVGLGNQALQASNAAQQAQAGFNNAANLQGFQARMSALQPQQNLLEALTALQGQARGISSTENVLGGKNYT